MNERICSVCHVKKSITDFYKDKSKKIGISSTCKECSKKYSKIYAIEHKDSILVYQKEYRKNNKVKHRKQIKQYYDSHKEELKAYRDEYKKNNKEKIKEQQKQYRLNNPEKIKNHDLFSSYGITLAEYNSMLESQNNVCAICGNCETEKTDKNKNRNLAVDHNHKTGKIRGLLCGKCNKMIGLANDNITILQSAINYLRNV